MNIAYNRDCLEAMRKMPDNAFDLAVCDPPYGDALANESGGGTWNRFGGRFDKYKTNRPLAQQLPQERERDAERDTDKERTAESRTEHGVMRTGGTWATKYAKKSLSGT